MANVWVVDDDAHLLMALGVVLEGAGHVVVSFNGGQGVLDALGSGHGPDVLVLDLSMPPPDGNDVLKALPPAVPPVVIVTGWSDKVAGDLLGRVAAVLDKPVTAEALLGAVDAALARGPKP